MQQEAVEVGECLASRSGLRWESANIARSATDAMNKFNIEKVGPS